MTSSFSSAKKIPFLFFVAYLICGILIFRDFGLSWDEDMSRISTAMTEYNFAVHGAREALVSNIDKYHGPAFELVLFAADRMLHLTDTRQVYFLHHFLTFFFFWLS